MTAKYAPAVIALGVLWLFICFWIGTSIQAHNAPPPSPAVAEADPLLRQLTEDNEHLRSENATLREQLRACQSKPNVLPSARGDDPEDDPGR